MHIQCTCEHCGRTFERLKNGARVFRFCSLACWGAQRKTGKCAEKTCDQCSGTFAVWPHQANDPRKKFCSLSCRNAFFSDHAQRVATMPCGTCGQPTPAPRWRLKINPTPYCSPACGAIGRRKGQWLPCDACGALIYLYRKAALRKRHHYCDMSCRNTGLRNRWGKTRRSMSYQHWRNAVLARDGHRCVRCGAGVGPLHAHHIKSWRRYVDLRFDVANGATLCKPCHVAVHVARGGFWNATITPV